MKRLTIFSIFYFSSAIFFSACGGGSSGNDSGLKTTTSTTIKTTTTTTTTTTLPILPILPSVSAITAGTAIYNKVATFTVTGQNLNNGITVNTNDACTNLTEKPGGTATSTSFSCIPTSVGSFNIIVADSVRGGILSQTSVAVPFPQVTIVTSMGTIIVELYPNKAPITVSNYLQYVNEGYYTNTSFYRVIKNAVIQGGGNGAGTLHSPIALEPPSVTGLSNMRGTIAMVRTTNLNSATSDFFINTVNNNSSSGNNLDTGSGGYAVFGAVIQGIDIVKTIEATAVDSNSKPTTTVTIISASQTNSINVTTPAAPSGLVATGGTNQHNLTWNAVPTATSYNVYASTTAGTLGTRYTGRFSPLNITNVPANTTSYYTVTAVNSAGESAPSTQVFATSSP